MNLNKPYLRVDLHASGMTKATAGCALRLKAVCKLWLWLPVVISGITGLHILLDSIYHHVGNNRPQGYNSTKKKQPKQRYER